MPDPEVKMSHILSVDTAYLWWDLHKRQKAIQDDPEEWQALQNRKDKVLEAYIALRRSIPKGEDGKRYGHRNAYDALQGKVFSGLGLPSSKT